MLPVRMGSLTTTFEFWSLGAAGEGPLRWWRNGARGSTARPLAAHSLPTRMSTDRRPGASLLTVNARCDSSGRESFEQYSKTEQPDIIVQVAPARLR